jgi:hypothetical protein
MHVMIGWCVYLLNRVFLNIVGYCLVEALGICVVQSCMSGMLHAQARRVLCFNGNTLPP